MWEMFIIFYLLFTCIISSQLSHLFSNLYLNFSLRPWHSTLWYVPNTPAPPLLTNQRKTAWRWKEDEPHSGMTDVYTPHLHMRKKHDSLTACSPTSGFTSALTSLLVWYLINGDIPLVSGWRYQNHKLWGRKELELKFLINIWFWLITKLINRLSQIFDFS